MEVDELEEAYEELASLGSEQLREALNRVVQEHQALPELLAIAAPEPAVPEPEETGQDGEDVQQEPGRFEAWRTRGRWLLVAAIILGAAVLGTLIASRSCSTGTVPTTSRRGVPQNATTTSGASVAAGGGSTTGEAASTPPAPSLSPSLGTASQEAGSENSAETRNQAQERTATSTGGVASLPNRLK